MMSVIYMKNNIDRNIFSIVWGVCLSLLFIIIFIGYKGSYAYFGDPSSGSGNLGGEIYSVYYYRNWPGIEDTEYVEDKKYNITLILNYDELFEELGGYRFIGWNSLPDGRGISFNVDSTFMLTADMNLYAQWRLIVAYGDVNEDMVVNENDSLLIEKHVNGESLLEGSSLVNADVNVDGVVNFIDLDIVEQVCLETVGYVGYLPNKPILKYDIYEGNVDIGTDKPVEDEKDNNTSNNNIGGGTGLGNGGGGNQSSGNGQGGSSSNNGGNGGLGTENNINDGNIEDNDGDTDIDGTNEDLNTEINKNTFKFRFMNGNLEYASSECVINDGECLLVLPEGSPKVEGYKFTGWSEELGCPDNRRIKKSVYVNSDKVYYACFVDNKNWKNVYLFIIILIICLTAFRLIWNLISNFKKENNVGDNDGKEV